MTLEAPNCKSYMNIRKQGQSPLEDIQAYLEGKGYSPGTVSSYLYVLKIYFQANPNMETYTYQDVLTSLERYTGDRMKLNSRKGYLNAIKQYYNFLIDTGKREDHPCNLLNFKGNVKRKIIHSDLFAAPELELLLQKEERFPKQKWRNHVLASLLIYQGAMPGEIVKMKVNHIDLDEGTVYLPGGRILMARKLPMQPKQYRIMDKYMNEAREAMKKEETDSLLLGYRGKAISVVDINYFIETFKGLFPDWNLTTKTIRDSVISNWLNENKFPLDQVQMLAGLRWISSAERYIQIANDEQREILKKVHPLG